MVEVALWQYRWVNPGDETNITPDMVAWVELKPRNPLQTMEQRLDEIRGYRYEGKPCYEVRALAVIDGVEVPRG